MESFEINGVEYFVKWTHTSQPELSKRITLCEIFDSLPPKSTETEKLLCSLFAPITYAYSELSKKDFNKFSRKFGRRLSFQRALFGGFNKTERAAIWKYALEHFEAKLR